MNGRKVIVDNLTGNCSPQVQWILNANVWGKAKRIQYQQLANTKGITHGISFAEIKMWQQSLPIQIKVE